MRADEAADPGGDRREGESHDRAGGGDALRRSEALLRAVFERALDALILADDRGVYLDANPAAASLFGLPREALLGKTIAEFAGPDFDVPAAWDAFRREGTARGEFRLFRPDGSIRETEYAASTDVVPGLHLWAVRDVTQRVRAEDALRSSEGRFRRVLESSRDVIYQLNLTERTYDYVSPSIRDVLGIDPEEVAAGGLAGILQRVHPEDLRQLRDVVDRLMVPRPELDYGPIMEYRALVPGKGWRWISDNGAAIRDAGGMPVAIVGNVRDVTEEKLAADRLRDLSRRLLRAEEESRRHLARELHDEIGQALMAIKLNVRAALRDPAGPGSARGLAEVLALVDRTIAQVRDISLDLRPSMLDDLGLVDALRSHVRGFAQRSGLDARFSAEGGIGRHEPDVETACYRIVQEALTNVARHASARSVRVELSRAGERLLLVVADDGDGFDVPSATARATGGESLGLLGMGERAMLVGGTLAIVSTAGRGTELVAEFPIGSVPPARIPSEGPPWT